MNTLAPAEQLLALLLAHPGGVLARSVRDHLGSRVAEAATTLRDRGHELATDGDTWRLACAPDHFDPAAFEAARAGRWGAPCEIWEMVPSTNDVARAAALGGAPDGALYLAECQTAGRGRQGRTWTCAPHAGLLASWIVRAPLDAAAQPTLLPLAVGLGLCEGLRAASGLPVRTKWPNDLWLAGGKLGGVLVEARPGAAGFAIVGMGVNFAAHAADGATIGRQVASLQPGGTPLRREAVLAAALAGAERAVDAWRSGCHAGWLADWQALDMTLGRTIQMECGGESITGRAVGVSATGCLQIATGDGRVRECAAGEVHLR